MAVTLTESAAERVRTMLAKRGHGLGLKLATKVSGCAGFAYVVDYADEITDDDAVFESYGQKVVVPKKSLEQVDGTELDYVKESLLNEGFEFHNPKVKDACGCGESFTV
ncbi:iron-sulfur cluster assembly accessory protein [Hydrogenovibrio sp. JE_KL2]|jgi:iron-sulfur cluster assembly protein|uniref:HesB/IscA family protein n=1 Tax=Hydrogenovibrio sp. JE_KL2 TaxID=2651188 RepID=UPI00128E5AAC|nr:iron-sulfur cluster assembly accessory protein [Hydrogenovibrio sp. JE_KL2]MBN2606066.1 iron-sulfur cluster assembly accessory protein [Thiotrichales bacterium]MPQ75621.1 iron-sulfur cluster assembly accessory protein [Hydrogenovibrio sp. JE_KL2]